MNHFAAISQSIIDGDEKQSVSLCRKLLGQGYHPMDILDKGLIPAMNRLGKLLNEGEMFIPQVLMSTQAMQATMTELNPALLDSATRRQVQETVIIGTVEGDIHTIGKNLVGVVLHSAGFEVVDLGCNVSTQLFAEAVREHSARIVSLSAMLTVSMNSMRKIVRELQREDFGYPLHVIVGGCPITPNFAREIGAGYAVTMMDTLRLALEYANIGSQSPPGDSKE